MSKITCLHPGWIIPVEPRTTVYSAHALAMRNDKILAILPSDEARIAYPDAEHLALPDHAVLPGFINLHAHAAMNLLRGLADDTPLMTWLQEHIWPAEARHVSDAFVYEGSLLAMAELLRGGTTTINDMYFHHTAVARAGLTSGMRTLVGCSILEFPTPYAADAKGYLAHALAAHTEFAGQNGVDFTLAPHAPYTVSDATFREVIALSNQHDMRIHCHIHETDNELEQSLRDHGMRPLQRLRQLGLLSERLIAAHVVHATDEEIQWLASSGTHVAHNPASNLKLASGFARVQAMRDAGVNVGLGTDGSASNNQLDMLGDIRLAALLAKAQSKSATAVDAHAALEMATLAGAKAIGKGDAVGSLVPGKQADVIAIDLGSLETQPVYDPVSQIVYAAGREHVRHVWVGGRHVLADRELQTLDMCELKAKAKWWRERIAG